MLSALPVHSMRVVPSILNCIPSGITSGSVLDSGSETVPVSSVAGGGVVSVELSGVFSFVLDCSFGVSLEEDDSSVFVISIGSSEGSPLLGAASEESATANTESWRSMTAVISNTRIFFIFINLRIKFIFI